MVYDSIVISSHEINMVFLTGITKNHVYHHMYTTYIMFSICYLGYFFTFCDEFT